MRKIMTMTVLSLLTLALTATAAFAVTKRGTNLGEALYGTNYADTMLGHGGADLIYGYGGADVLYGGDEAGLGDKILGGSANDQVLGEGGDDRVYGGLGNDIVVGGTRSDTLSGGPGVDRINAQDGVKDTINVCGSVSGDTIYYDRGVDVLLGCTPQATAREIGEVELSAEQPPQSLFAHTGKVLVAHRGKEVLLSEKELKGHIGHGDQILDPTGRSGTEQQGQR